MKHCEKTKQLSLAILDTADKLGFKDSASLLSALCLATVEILGAVSAYSTLSPKEIANIYTKQINKII